MSDEERYLGLGDGGGDDPAGESGDRDGVEGGDAERDGGETAAREEADLDENVSHRFDRLAPTDSERTVAGRPSREAVLAWWENRFGVPPETFAEHTFWEKGNGKLWVLAGDAKNPSEVEALGTTVLRTRQEHWKPTTDAAQRFGPLATQNVIDLDRGEATAFAAGEDQEIERWDGDWGYLIAAHELAGERAVLGVGLYVHGELRSMVPKGRQRDL